MYLLNNDHPNQIEETTFAELGKRESYIEEILRKNVDMICDDAESMLIVGQQVKNQKNGRSDLTAMDDDGNIVLIEIKRDKKDIELRREAFEFQAIRYAASCATIKSTDELIQNVFAPYVEKHKAEFQTAGTLTSTEIAQRSLDDFIRTNDIKSFNERQRIVLVASEFDEQTLSAVAWLNSNQVDISCYQVKPYKLGEQVLLDMKKILPVPEFDDFYVDIAGPKTLTKERKQDITRRSLPKIDAMLSWGVVKPEAVLGAKGRADEAILLENGQVKVKSTGEVQSMQQWLKSVYGWSSVETYAFAIDKKSGKSLAELRAEYMEKNQH